jgi:hypothetical protein
MTAGGSRRFRLSEETSVSRTTIHGRSGLVGVTSRVDVGQEGVQLLVGVEDAILGEVVRRLDGPDMLAPRQLIDRY